MASSRSQNPFLLLLLTVGLLSLLSLLKPDLTVGSIGLRPVRLLADVLSSDSTAIAMLAAPLLNSLATSVPTAGDTTRAAALPAPKRTKSLTIVPLGLENFLAALHQTKATGRKTRIAYFGDSMVEGDILTSDLRNSLQTEFGGSGVGFVSINSVTAEYRETIHQTFSPDWYEYNLVSDRRPANFPLGISGHAFAPREVADADSTGIIADTSWVQFRGGQHFASTRRFAGARLFYGPGSGRDRVLVTANGRKTRRPLAGNAPVNELVLPLNPAAQQLRLAFATHGPRPVYGVSFESPQGITLDNFSFRGNSGPALLRIPAEQLAAFGRALDYRLIILHYGVNIADTRNKNYDFYEESMIPVVERMQQAFPQASILIIGMSDKSIRINGEFVSDPTVPLLVAAQQRLARRTHVAFWDLFAAMGGSGTMTSWVEQLPPLAHNDYLHITSRGGQRLADLLHTYLMSGYEPASAVVGIEAGLASARH